MSGKNRVSEDALRDYFAYSPAGVEVEEDGLIEVNLGEFLVDRSVITREQLLAALQLQDRNPGVRLGECIASLGYLTYAQVEAAMREWQAIQTVEV